MDTIAATQQQRSAVALALASAAAGWAAAALCNGTRDSRPATGAPKTSAPPLPAAAHIPAGASAPAPAVAVEKPIVVALVPMKHTSLRVPGGRSQLWPMLYILLHAPGVASHVKP